MKTPKAQEFDTLVVGAGLSGLLAASALEATGRNVVLIEAKDTLGGASRAGQTVAGPTDYGLKLMPATDTAHAALDWLETQIGEKIERTEVEAAPMNYDEGKFKPYVGFGDAGVTTATEIEAYALHKRLRLSSTPKDWVAKLAQTYSGTLLTQSIVTKMFVEDGFVIEATINGSKRISAREVVFATNPQLLPSLLGEAAVAPRVRQKLLKGDFFTSVNLDIVHGTPVTDTDAVHVLKGANEEPTVGVFHPAVVAEDGRKLQVSQWMTLIPRDQTDEEELVGAALKQIKRQIKRAYESAMDPILQERILVVPSSHGNLHGVFDQAGRLPKIENLWVTSALFASERNTLGTLMQTRQVVESLGAEPPILDDAERPLTTSAEA